eukprot:9491318-Pyramimonas_sp.AAC.1
MSLRAYSFSLSTSNAVCVSPKAQGFSDMRNSQRAHQRRMSFHLHSRGSEAITGAEFSALTVPMVTPNSSVRRPVASQPTCGPSGWVIGFATYFAVSRGAADTYLSRIARARGHSRATEESAVQNDSDALEENGAGASCSQCEYNLNIPCEARAWN